MNFQRIQIKYDFSKFEDVFLKQNSILNLISKNEERFLYPKHIYDSLGIKLFIDKYKVKDVRLLDIGTGGGFPAVPISLEYKDIEVVALDSIQKKINAIENIKNELNIENLSTICNRAENIKNQKFDIITTRAVSSIKNLVKYSNFLLKDGGYFIAYKSKLADTELKDAKFELKQYKLKLIDDIKYRLPLEELYERRLIIFQKIT